MREYDGQRCRACQSRAGAPLRQRDRRRVSCCLTAGQPDERLLKGECRFTLLATREQARTPVQTQTSYPTSASMPIGNGQAVVACRQMVRQITDTLHFSIMGQTMLVTAASELARNTLIHGGGGTFSWKVVQLDGRYGVRLTFEDSGPGILNLELAMTNGWSSAKSLGLGLPGAKRLVNEFELQSTPGRGTRVVVVRWA
jgi:serine/threonine-protein kinase RsbT